MTDPSAFAFIDVETTGLDPKVNRIAEIGVVTLDGVRESEWTTFIAQRNGRARRPRTLDATDNAEPSAAPAFRDVASDLARRLAGRVLVAHNARFDYAFLKAEFERVGVDFRAEVLCSLMLSRHFYPGQARHDLDSVADRHRLGASIRHRALPDARLVARFWEAIQREFAAEDIAASVRTLVSAPVLPEQLDPALLERVPEAPGVYIFHDEQGKPFQVGQASNLRLHLIDYFRLDRASAKALTTAHRITKLTWRVTQGILGARLQKTLIASELSPQAYARDNAVFLWQLIPDEYPCVQVVDIDRASLASVAEYFGMFRSERKAHNALRRLASRKFLCHGLLGIPQRGDGECLACAERSTVGGCQTKAQRLKHLMKVFAAIRPLRVSTWPYPGAIGVRERGDVHIFDEWRYLGTARSEAEIRDVLNCEPRRFDKETFSMLSATLAALPKSRILDLAHAGSHCSDSMPD